MRAIPFFLVIFILVGGVAAAFQNLSSYEEDEGAPIERPTVTPRPRATSSRQATSTPTAKPSPTWTPQPTATSQPTPTATAQPLQATPSSVATRTATPQVNPRATTAPTGPTPVPSPTRGQAPPTPGAPQTATPTPAPGQPTAQPTTATVLRVGNTDGVGVFLRRTPRMEDKIRPWLDGTAMVVVGPTVRGEGRMWAHVRAPDGVEGYIPVEHLIGTP